MIKKLLLIFFAILLFFSFSCSIQKGDIEENSTQTDKNIIEKPKNDAEVVEKEDKYSKEEASSNGNKTGKSNQEDINNEDTVENNKGQTAESTEQNNEEQDVKNKNDNKKEPPSINLEVIYGPAYAQEGNICFYRVKANVSGNPMPEIIFSKDDSNGNWGKDTSQVNLKQDESLSLEAKAVNDYGEANDSIVLEWKDKENIHKEEVIDYSNADNFKISVILEEQIVRVYYKEELLKEMICSGGTAEDPTPTGTFKTNEKIYYCWLPKYDVGAYYYIRFYGSYLFHSVPFDENGNIIQEELEKLGNPASHGCIRLKVEDAKWLYETFPLGIEVNIY